MHTDEPERATAVFAEVGEVSRLDVADMRLQVSEREQRLGDARTACRRGGTVDGGAGGVDREQAGEPAGGRPVAAGARVRCGAVAVVSGDGLRAMFEELGVHTIDGGPTMNPSTYDLLAAIHEVQAEEVVVLPNSANVIMAAEHAAELSDKQVLVARATSQQAGLAAAVALESERTVEENARALNEALAHLRTGAVAQAARDDAQGRFGRGEAVGFVADEVVAWGEPEETLRTVLTSARRRRGADQRARGPGRAAASRGTWPGWSTVASSWSNTTAVRPPTGGCWPRSDDRGAVHDAGKMVHGCDSHRKPRAGSERETQDPHTLRPTGDRKGRVRFRVRARL